MAMPKCSTSRPVHTWTAYDLFTGEEIIPARYDMIGKAGSYVFARADNTWDVHRVQKLGTSQ